MSAETKAQKCVHKGCGKVFADLDEPCVYHPGPPEFHEGQKGWKCCKPRVLTFDEFLAIPPCTTGTHSTVDDTPKEEKPQVKEQDLPRVRPINASVPVTKPIASSDSTSMASLTSAINIAGLGGTPKSTTPTTPPTTQLEEDSDEDGVEVKAGTTCKRRKCGQSYDPQIARSNEKCVYHPGQPIFHEGSKGWTCCKRRVLEFEEFMKIQGCKERSGHCYSGKRQKTDKRSARGDGDGDGGGEELLDDIRSDYYQTSSSVIVSYFLKKIDKSRAIVAFTPKSARLDLPTTDGKRFNKEVEWWGEIDPAKSQFKIMGTKLEMTLAKAGQVLSWPVLRVGDRETGERIQLGRAGRA
ncbi:hypothetical protein DV737_g510, partial [Chaetothyriales sp. CBS 132003]